MSFRRPRGNWENRFLLPSVFFYHPSFLPSHSPVFLLFIYPSYLSALFFRSFLHSCRILLFSSTTPSLFLPHHRSSFLSSIDLLSSYHYTFPPAFLLSFLPTYLPSFLPFFLPTCLPSFLPTCHPFFFPSILLYWLTSIIPSSLPFLFLLWLSSSRFSFLTFSLLPILLSPFLFSIFLSSFCHFLSPILASYCFSYLLPSFTLSFFPFCLPSFRPVFLPFFLQTPTWPTLQTSLPPSFILHPPYQLAKGGTTEWAAMIGVNVGGLGCGGLGVDWAISSLSVDVLVSTHLNNHCS